MRERDDWVRNVASAGDALYAAFSGILVRYEVDGRVLEARWRTRRDYPIESAQPVVGEELIDVPLYAPGRDDGAVLVAEPSGEDRTEIELDYNPLQLTTTEDGPVVVPSATIGAGLRAIRPDGGRRWTADVSGHASAISANGTVYAGNPLIALDSESGERLWERNVVGVGGVVRLAAADSTLYVATHDRVVAFRE
ncbi:hypothetical protein [Halosolutus halophilus]|uniref:hypothetical protein n=1 Tax=Halosolutus halophilus TaxID=1552990 RepID=UPI0031F3282B